MKRASNRKSSWRAECSGEANRYSALGFSASSSPVSQSWYAPFSSFFHGFSLSLGTVLTASRAVTRRRARLSATTSCSSSQVFVREHSDSSGEANRPVETMRRLDGFSRRNGQRSRAYIRRVATCDTFGKISSPDD